MPGPDNQLPNIAQVAQELAASLAAAGQEYALGGAIALGYWGAPRGTLDVDVTIYIPVDQTSTCARLLQSIGCAFSTAQAIQSITEHGFCQVELRGYRIDVFLPISEFYEKAKARRRNVFLGDQRIQVWDAETLCVFKMIFFRRKDLADVEQILRSQGLKLDRSWVRKQLIEIYGARDLRISQWDELVNEQQ